MFIHGPFATRIFVVAGKLSTVEDEFLMDILKEREYHIRRKVNLRDYYKQSIAKMTRKLNSLMFPYMERIMDGIKLVLGDYEVSSNSTTYKFKNNTVYFYESGTGMFSTQVAVTFQREGQLASIKNAQRFARDIVTKKYENQLPSLIEMFSETIAKKGIGRVAGIASDSFMVGRLAWLHTVYYFCNSQFF